MEPIEKLEYICRKIQFYRNFECMYQYNIAKYIGISRAHLSNKVK